MGKSELYNALNQLSGLTAYEFEEAEKFWVRKTLKKGELFNTSGVVCKEIGFITKGIFRIYYYNDVSHEEQNVFFFTEGQFMISFQSFIRQFPCAYHIEALSDAEYISIRYEHIHELYALYPAWERLGRKLAEKYYEYAQSRMESLLFLNPEQRYLNLLKEYPDILNRIPLYHISSFLGIKNPSLSRIRKRLEAKK